MHWTLLVAEKTTGQHGTVSLFTSMRIPQTNDNGKYTNLRSFLEGISGELGPFYNIRWGQITLYQSWQETNGVDCGVYAVEIRPCMHQKPASSSDR